MEKSYLKWLYSAQGGLIFALLSSPIAYKITNKILDSSDENCATLKSLFLHTIIYILIVRIMMIG